MTASPSPPSIFLTPLPCFSPSPEPLPSTTHTQRHHRAASALATHHHHQPPTPPSPPLPLTSLFPFTPPPESSPSHHHNHLHPSTINTFASLHPSHLPLFSASSVFASLHQPDHHLPRPPRPPLSIFHATRAAAPSLLRHCPLPTLIRLPSRRRPPPPHPSLPIEPAPPPMVLSRSQSHHPIAASHRHRPCRPSSNKTQHPTPNTID